MPTLFTQPVFQLYVLCSGALVAILYGLGFYTAKLRNDRKQIINHEDIKVNSGAVQVDVEHPDVQRVKRAHANALENSVPFFVLGLLYSLTASPSLVVAQALFGTFVTVRLFHAIFYLGARQPFRTASFAVGALVNVALVVMVVKAAMM